jgi:hypothetical protein
MLCWVPLGLGVPFQGRGDHLLSPRSQSQLTAETYAQGAPDQLSTTFNSAAALEAAGWHSYFDSVYGVETMPFPFSLADLNFFYMDRLPSAVREGLTIRSPTSPEIEPTDDGSGELLRGDLYHVFSVNYLFRCTTDICSNFEAADDACQADGASHHLPAQQPR